MNDTDRLIKFMREEQAGSTDERESWFKATGDAIETLLTEGRAKDKVIAVVRGMIGAFELELREAISHTNINCLKDSLAELDSAQVGQKS